MAFLLIVHVPYEPYEPYEREPNKLVGEIRRISSAAGVAEKDAESEVAETEADLQKSGDSGSSSDDSSSSSSSDGEGEEAVGKNNEGSRDAETSQEIEGKQEKSDKQATKAAEKDDTAATQDTEAELQAEPVNTDNTDGDNVDKSPEKLDNSEAAKAANIVIETAESEPLGQAADKTDNEDDDKAKEKGDEDAVETVTKDGDGDKTEESKEGVDDEKDYKPELSTAELQALTPLLPELPLHKLVENALIGYEVESLDRTMIGDMSKVGNLDKADVRDKPTVKFSFIQTDSMRCENILNKLKSLGVGGKVAGSSISVFPASVHESGEESLKSSPQQEYTDEEMLKEEGNFKKSIKSRLVVNQVVASVRSNAIFTFDYLLLLILASCIACLGLVENSSVVLVASMLISPLMGPILAVTFGQVIGNKELRNVGVKSELLGLLLCIIVGLVFGLICGGIGLNGAVWGSTDSWPTSEMKSRGILRSLWVGILIAMPSGAGVAISVLGGNAGSLVGVAISASLLPPACNAGMLWGYSLLAAISPPEVVNNLTAGTTTAAPIITTAIMNISSTAISNLTITNTTTPATTTTMFNTSTPIPPSPTAVPASCLPLVNNAYRQFYSCDVARDAALLGLVSLLLTILNITCILIVGYVILKFKEVARPLTDASQSSVDHFWQEDIKVARTYYQTSKGAESKTLGKEILVEWKKFKEEEKVKKQKALQTLREEEEEGDDDDGDGETITHQMQTIDICNYISDIEQSPGIRHVLSKLSPATPTEPVTACLSGIYNQATQDIQNKLSKRPAVYLSEPKVRDKLVSNVYHTIHGPPSKQDKNSSHRPTYAELQGRLNRPSKSAYFESADLQMISEVDSGISLNHPSSSGLFKRRKKPEKSVKFQVTKVEEEALLP